MIKIKIQDGGTSSLVIITDIINKTKIAILSQDCEILLYDLQTPSFTGSLVRTISILNKYNTRNFTIINTNTLDPSSSFYDPDMDTYFNNLINNLNFETGTGSSSSDPNKLNYLLKDGSRIMTGSLNMNNNNIINIGSLNIKDNNFTLIDDADITKHVNFELSSISTSTSRILTIQDKSGTIALLADITSEVDVLSATNGLSVINNVINLGGNLIKNTDINLSSFNLKINDINNKNIINFKNRTLNDTSGLVSVDWRGRKLYSTSGVTLVDWQSGKLEGFYTPSGKWDLVNKKYVDSQINSDSKVINGLSVISGSVGLGGTLIQNSNLNLSTFNLIVKDENTKIIEDFKNRTLNDTSGLISVDWRGRILEDSTQKKSIDWQNRKLYSTSGVSIIDWLSGKLEGFYTPTGKWDLTNKKYVDESGSNSVQGSRTLLVQGTSNRVSVSGGTQNLFTNRTWSVDIDSNYTGQISIITLGNISTGTWNGSTITAFKGGTGQTTYTVGDILYASGSAALSKLADVATGNALISGGVGVAPSYGKIGLTTHISGILPVTNGGTGINNFNPNEKAINGLSVISGSTGLGGTLIQNTNINLNSFYLKINDNVNIINFKDRSLNDTNGLTSIDWKGRTLNDLNGNTIVIWNNSGVGINLNPSEKLTVGGRIRSTNSDIVVEDNSRGLILKDTQLPPHYWRITINNVGSLVANDLGTSLPSE